MTTTDRNADVSTMDIFRMLRGDYTPEDVHVRRAEAAEKKARDFRIKQIEEQFGKLSTLDLMTLRRRRKLDYFRQHQRPGFVFDPVQDREVKLLLDVVAGMIHRRDDIPRNMRSPVAQRREKARVNRGQGKSKNR